MTVIFGIIFGFIISRKKCSTMANHPMARKGVAFHRATVDERPGGWEN
jgi:hypothetical protein